MEQCHSLAGIRCIKTLLICLLLGSCSFFRHNPTIYDRSSEDVPDYYYQTAPTVPSRQLYEIRNNIPNENDQYYVAPYYGSDNVYRKRQSNHKIEIEREKEHELIYE